MRCYTPAQLVLDSIWLPCCQIPLLHEHSTFQPTFSADGSKFAVAATDGTVSVWDVRNKIPLMVKKANPDVDVESLEFSSGTLGREVLASTEVSQLCLDVIFFMLNESA